MMGYRKAICGFVDHFAEHATEIESVRPIMYRKILYAAALDPLARAAFGDIGNRARMVRLIDELTSWTNRDRVSLPQLTGMLKRKRRGRFRLNRIASTRLRNWMPGEVLRLDSSPLRVELEPHAAPSERALLAKCRYAELFYAYRNNLVHEFREPGYGIEMSADGSEPYYHSYINGPWELVFPVGFFANLFRDALTGLSSLLLRDRRSPYEQFQFGSLWDPR
jgi:hypothetical protein